MIPIAATVTSSVSALRTVGRRLIHSGIGQPYICSRRGDHPGMHPALHRMHGNARRITCVVGDRGRFRILLAATDLLSVPPCH